MAYCARDLIVGVVLGLMACGGTSKPSVDLSHPDAALDISMQDDIKDPCGPKQGSVYGCGYLVGHCPSPGLSCLCWEQGTMVCQADEQWELILDVTHCPSLGASYSYGGYGCLGAATTCTEPDGHSTCTCDDSTHLYSHCGVGLE